MELVNAQNNGKVQVSEELGEKLKATGLWKEPKAPAKRAAAKTAAPKEE